MIYKGLTGSRLFGSNLETSDWDFFLVGIPEERELAGQKGQDAHWVPAENFIHDVFDHPMPSSTRLFAELFSKPLMESEAATFLVENRELLMQSNLRRFGNIIYTYALGLSYQGAAQWGKRFPKRMVYAIRGLNEYIRYATEDVPFSEAMLQKGELLEFVKAIKARTVSYEEQIEVVNGLLAEAEKCKAFWDREPDLATFKRIKDEMTEVFLQS